MPGVAMGNYAGTQALYHNPAFVADSRYTFHVNLVGAQLFVANNHIKYNAPYSFLSMMTNSVPDKYRNEKGGIILPLSDLAQKLNGRPKHLNLGTEVRLPSVMLSLREGRLGVGVSTRLRVIGNLSGVTESLAQTLRSRAKDPTLMRTVFEDQAANLHLNGLGEVAFTVGGVVLDEDTEFVKVGLTAKRLVGLFNSFIQIEDGSYSVRPDPTYNNLKEIINVPDITTRYGYTTEGAFQNFQFSPAWLLGNAPAGAGWGFDVGVVYEYRPNAYKYAYTEKGVRKLDASKNKYLYRVSLSLVDIGRIRYKNLNYVQNFGVTATDKSFRFDDFQKLQGSAGFFNGVNKSLGVDTTDVQGAYKSVLPTTFQASIDYMIKPNLYVNTLWVQSLRAPGAFGMKGESVLAVTPRYETRWYDVSVPIAIMNRYGSFGIGLAGRVGPLWFGTDHLAGLLNIGKPKMFNLYAGVSMGLFRKPPKSPNPCYLEEREPIWERLFRKRRF